METKDLLEVLSKELEFYRRRQLSIHYFTLLSQVLIITGQQKISVQHEIIANIAYIGFFIIIAIFNWHFSKSYVERIHTLRGNRTELIENDKLKSPFPRHGEYKTKSPNELYKLTIVLLSFIGIVLVLLDK